MPKWLKKKRYAASLGTPSQAFRVFRIPTDAELKKLFAQHMQENDPMLASPMETLKALSNLPSDEAIRWIQTYVLDRKEKWKNLIEHLHGDIDSFKKEEWFDRIFQNGRLIRDHENRRSDYSSDHPLFALLGKSLKSDHHWLTWLWESHVSSNEKTKLLEFLDENHCFFHKKYQEEEVLNLLPSSQAPSDIRPFLYFLGLPSYEFELRCLQENPKALAFLQVPENLKEFILFFGNTAGDVVFNETLFQLLQTPESLDVFQGFHAQWSFDKPVVDLLASTLHWKTTSEIKPMLEKASSYGLEMTSMDHPEYWVSKSLSSIQTLSQVESGVEDDIEHFMYLEKNPYMTNLLQSLGLTPEEYIETLKANAYEKWQRQKEYWREVLTWVGDLNTQDPRGWSALHRAAFEESPFAVELLLKAGANPLLETQEGFRPSQLLRFAISTEAEYPSQLNRSEELEAYILQLLEQAELTWLVPSVDAVKSSKMRL